MKDIHPNLAPISFPFLTILDWLIIIILAGFVVYLLWSQRQKSAELNQIIAQPKINYPKFLLAKELRKLAKLKSAKKWKEFVLRATEILKKYLEQKYQQPFLFATGSELTQELKNKVPAEDLEKFRGFFQFVDPVKFADRDLADEQADKVLQFLKEIK